MFIDTRATPYNPTRCGSGCIVHRGEYHDIEARICNPGSMGGCLPPRSPVRRYATEIRLGLSDGCKDRGLGARISLPRLRGGRLRYGPRGRVELDETRAVFNSLLSSLWYLFL